MKTANMKMRRLAFFYCTIIAFFTPRAAYTGLLAYASSESATDCSDSDSTSSSICDVCEPVPAIIYNWTLLTQENNAILAALSSAMLTVMSVWFMLTADEKRLLRTGRAVAVETSETQTVEAFLHARIGLNQVH